jgi:hypothetical protein
MHYSKCQRLLIKTTKGWWLIVWAMSILEFWQIHWCKQHLVHIPARIQHNPKLHQGYTSPPLPYAHLLAPLGVHCLHYVLSGSGTRGE